MTCRTLETFYHINAHTFEKQYKETLSGYCEWDEPDNADKWLLFPENIGLRLAIDKSSLSNDELYAFVTNRDRHALEGSLVAVVAGTKSEAIIQALKQIGKAERMKVEEVTLDLSDSMRKIVSVAFPNAKRVIDRFHIQKLAGDAVQEIRVAHRWDALQQSNGEMEECKLSGKTYMPFVSPTETHAPNCLLEVVTCCLNQQINGRKDKKERARILFDEYPDIKVAYGLSHSLRMIFSKNTIKDAARLSMAKWYDKVERAGMKQFNVIAATFYEHYDEILNFYNNRSTNAAAESFNAEIKLFRANLHGVTDKKFFLFRIAKLYGYSH